MRRMIATGEGDEPSVVEMPTFGASAIDRDLYFAVAGYVLGLRAPGMVPIRELRYGFKAGGC